MYRVQSLALLVALLSLFAWVGHLVFGLTGAIVILALGILLNLASARTASGMILRMHGARPISVHEAPGLHRVADRLARIADVPRPSLAIYPSDVPNAFALWTAGPNGIVAVSTGLVRVLDSHEITGVLAHEFAHLKNRDSVISLSAGLFVQTISTMASVFGFALFLLAFTGAMPGGDGTILPAALLAIGAPYLAQALQAALMRTRERLADETAVAFTGDARSLASALVKLERYNRYLQGLFRRFRFIYTTGAEEGAEWLRTHPTTEERVRNLADLERRLVPHPAHAYQRAV